MKNNWLSNSFYIKIITLCLIFIGGITSNSNVVSAKNDSSPESTAIEAQSVREFIKKLSQDGDYSSMIINREKVKTIYVYEGNESDLELFSLKQESSFSGFNNSSVTAFRRVNHERNIRLGLDAKVTSSSLHLTLESKNIDLIIDQENAIIYMKDIPSLSVYEGDWPLDWTLGQEAGYPLTGNQVAELLKTHYHWECGLDQVSGVITVDKPQYSDEVIWDSNYKGKTVRDLLGVLLKNLPSTSLSTQVKAINRNENGVISWDLCTF